MIRKSYAALQNLVTSMPNPNSDLNPNPMLSGQVESESEKPARIHITAYMYINIYQHGSIPKMPNNTIYHADHQ